MNGKRTIRKEEYRYAVEEFQELLSILTKVRCIVLVGRSAQKIKTKVDLCGYQVLESFLPSPIVKNIYPHKYWGIPDIWRQANR